MIKDDQVPSLCIVCGQFKVYDFEKYKDLLSKTDFFACRECDEMLKITEERKCVKCQSAFTISVEYWKHV